jgi:hypothetical protein
MRIAKNICIKHNKDNVDEKNQETKTQRISSYDTSFETSIQLGDNISKKKFVKHDNGGSGDCLFLTLVQLIQRANPEEYKKLIGDVNAKAQQIRNNIVDYVCDDNNKNTQYGQTGFTYNEVLTVGGVNGGGAGGGMLYKNPSGSNLGYQTVMKKPAVFGTDLEISAAAKKYKLNIYVVSSDGINLDTVYFSDDKPNYDLTKLWYIFNINQGHYVSLWCLDGEGSCPPNSGAEPDAAGAAGASAVSAASAGLKAAAAAPKPAAASGGKLHSGVVQVKGGAFTDARTTMMPILEKIKCLIDIGYEHIGLTYSANQSEQSNHILPLYGWGDGKVPQKNADILDPSKKITLAETTISGTGQAHSLEGIYELIGQIVPGYETKFRIIPFSTIRDSGSSNNLDTKNAGSYQDCINFAEAFLKLPKSIIIGWCDNHSIDIPLGSKPKPTDENIMELYEKYEPKETAIQPINTGPPPKFNKFRDKHFAVGGNIMPENASDSRITYIPGYLKWLVKNWNPEAQKLVNDCKP